MLQAHFQKGRGVNSETTMLGWEDSEAMRARVAKEV